MTLRTYCTRCGKHLRPSLIRYLERVGTGWQKPGDLTAGHHIGTFHPGCAREALKETL
jgi:hypothetical protein